MEKIANKKNGENGKLAKIGKNWPKKRLIRTWTIEGPIASNSPTSAAALLYLNI